jgi:sortase (surface protein transpeptidase)
MPAENDRVVNSDTIDLAKLIAEKREKELAAIRRKAIDTRNLGPDNRVGSFSQNPETQTKRRSKVRYKSKLLTKLFTAFNHINLPFTGRVHAVTLGILAGLLVVGYFVFVPIQAKPKNTNLAPNIKNQQEATLPAAPAATKNIIPTNRLTISALGINAPIINVGVDSSGNLDTPKTLYQVARYNAGANYGQNGTVIIDGHSGSPSQLGIFKHLSSLPVGAFIGVNLVNGHSYTYQVTSSAVYDLSHATAVKLFTQTATPTMNIISCIGTWDPKTDQFSQRWIVTAKLVAST